MPKQPARKTDKQMILSPDDWPKWPLLPMIKRGDDPACGVIVGDPQGDYVWFVTPAYVFRITEAEINKVVRWHVDDLIADGWEVD